MSIDACMDQKRVTAAVRIKISIDRMTRRGNLNFKDTAKKDQLFSDLVRLTRSMTPSEYQSYSRRIQ